MPDSAIEILLVEDNPTDLELTLHVFEKHRLANRVHVARDGAEAIQFLFPDEPEAAVRRRAHLKVIALDLKLPKISGLEVLSRLKADVATRSIPVVVLTSSREERDLEKAYEFGANSYVVKPVDYEQLNKFIGDLASYWLVLNHTPARKQP